MVSAHRLLRPAALILLGLAGGCAVDCTRSDWRQRGYADGFGGHPPQDLRIERHCPAFSQASYLEGWRDGYDEWYRLIGSMQRRMR
jgi:hypothetical protein